MANCNPVCKLCPRLVLSQSIVFNGTSLVVNLPAGAYNNNAKYCIILAQSIPVETTITAPVVITVGEGTEEYPLVNSCCAPVTACGIRTRTKYSTVVSTSATGGTFKMLGRPCCAPANNLAAIDGTAPAAEGGAGA